MTDSEEKCTICLEEMLATSLRVDLCCNHRFHDDCAAQLVESMRSATCPLCRSPFELKQVVNERNQAVDIADTRWPGLLQANKERRSAETAHQEFMEAVLRTAFHHIQFQHTINLPILFSGNYHVSSVSFTSSVNPFSYSQDPDDSDNMMLRILQAAVSSSPIRSTPSVPLHRRSNPDVSQVSMSLLKGSLSACLFSKL
jgi:hypothetical protein